MISLRCTTTFKITLETTYWNSANHHLQKNSVKRDKDEEGGVRVGDWVVYLVENAGQLLCTVDAFSQLIS